MASASSGPAAVRVLHNFGGNDERTIRELRRILIKQEEGDDLDAVPGGDLDAVPYNPESPPKGVQFDVVISRYDVMKPIKIPFDKLKDLVKMDGNLYIENEIPWLADHDVYFQPGFQRTGRRFDYAIYKRTDSPTKLTDTTPYTQQNLTEKFDDFKRLVPEPSILKYDYDTGKTVPDPALDENGTRDLTKYIRAIQTMLEETPDLRTRENEALVREMVSEYNRQTNPGMVLGETGLAQHMAFYRSVQDEWPTADKTRDGLFWKKWGTRLESFLSDLEAQTSTPGSTPNKSPMIEDVKHMIRITKPDEGSSGAGAGAGGSEGKSEGKSDDGSEDESDDDDDSGDGDDSGDDDGDDGDGDDDDDSDKAGAAVVRDYYIDEFEELYWGRTEEVRSATMKPFLRVTDSTPPQATLYNPDGLEFYTDLFAKLGIDIEFTVTDTLPENAPSQAFIIATQPAITKNLFHTLTVQLNPDDDFVLNLEGSYFSTTPTRNNFPFVTLRTFDDGQLVISPVMTDDYLDDVGIPRTILYCAIPVVYELPWRHMAIALREFKQEFVDTARTIPFAHVVEILTKYPLMVMRDRLPAMYRRASGEQIPPPPPPAGSQQPAGPVQQPAWSDVSPQATPTSLAPTQSDTSNLIPDSSPNAAHISAPQPPGHATPQPPGPATPHQRPIPHHHPAVPGPPSFVTPPKPKTSASAGGYQGVVGVGGHEGNVDVGGHEDESVDTNDISVEEADEVESTICRQVFLRFCKLLATLRQSYPGTDEGKFKALINNLMKLKWVQEQLVEKISDTLNDEFPGEQAENWLPNYINLIIDTNMGHTDEGSEGEVEADYIHGGVEESKGELPHH